MANYFISETVKSYSIAQAAFCKVGSKWNTNSWSPKNNPTGYHALYYRTDHTQTKAFLHMSNTTLEILPDKIYFVPAFSVLRSEIDGEMQKYYIHFQCDYIDFGLWQYIADNYCISATSITKALFDIIVENYDKKTVSANRKVCGAMDILLSDLLDSMAIQPKTAEKFKPIFSYIETHYREKIAIQDLAKIMNLSTVYFSNSFKEAFHISPKQYILWKRLSQSQYLLARTDLSIKEIAQNVGFENENYFSEYFSAKVGVSALQYRNKLSGYH